MAEARRQVLIEMHTGSGVVWKVGERVEGGVLLTEDGWSVLIEDAAPEPPPAVGQQGTNTG